MFKNYSLLSVTQQIRKRRRRSGERTGRKTRQKFKISKNNSEDTNSNDEAIKLGIFNISGYMLKKRSGITIQGLVLKSIKRA
ncbi:hypothetical protein GDO78_014439 [Eleutherodactylus coqui]|uniref:Uncharacterized protein n=1 Tax=Eleutherodactylus coqui TaxID=57060 RepID=A0A8J6EC10_ELECQ|nr:hypothetical protein GDO78_014439 [Eleutherodactylus coqui]